MNIFGVNLLIMLPEIGLTYLILLMYLYNEYSQYLLAIHQVYLMCFLKTNQVKV